jgi:nicotinamidase-related amidase
LETKAVIVIDMLVDFVTGDLKLDRAKPLTPKIKRLVESARKHGIPVIYCNDAHLPIDHEVVERWGLHAIKGTRGAQAIPELKPASKDYTVEKRAYSGFFETGLDSLLRSLNKGEGVKAVILCGLHTHICVRHTVSDAFSEGTR